MNDKVGFFGGTAGLFAAILTAHIIGDLFFRVDAWFDIYKTTLGYLVHVFTWTSLISLVLAIYKRFTVPKFIFLFTAHYIIDINKLLFFKYGSIENIITDQTLHMISIILVLIWPGVIMRIRKKVHS
jgi:hypothetical protein